MLQVVTLKPPNEEQKEEEEDCPDADIDDPTPNNVLRHAKCDQIAVGGMPQAEDDLQSQIKAIEQVYKHENAQ